MASYRGVPLRDRDDEKRLAKRSGWGVSDADVVPGDVIEAGQVLASGDWRYLEHVTRHTDGSNIEEGDPITISLVDLDEPIQPCTFCSPAGAVAERGIIDSDYELRTLDGELLAKTCLSCISGAPVVEVGE